jgi:hypothetical protein
MTEYVETAEEKAFGALWDEKRAEITEAARHIVGLAEGCSYIHYCCRNYCVQDEEELTDWHNLLCLAYLLTQHDREALSEVAQAAKAASDSLDKDDFDTPAGYRISISDRHCYYAMISEMVEEALKPTGPQEIKHAQLDLWLRYREYCAAEGRSRS